MANMFLCTDPKDVETALIYEQAIIHDIGSAVAYTNGFKIYINTEDNLEKILPVYNHDMLKWLLWHEKLHIELKHSARYFQYLEELKRSDSRFSVSHQEVNIIMDILVHDTLCNWFPELIDIAKANLSQLRNRNSLGYTFTTYTLEDMLEEYRLFKETIPPDEDGETPSGGGGGSASDEPSATDPPSGQDSDEEDDSDAPKTPTEQPPSEEKEDDQPNEDTDDTDGTDEKPNDTPSSEHDEVDWDRLKDRSEKEFLDDTEARQLDRQINELRTKKIKLATVTKTINGLTTSTRRRSYAMPSTIQVGNGVLLKGRVPGKAQLYLCFDASGSMWKELELFKEIITKSIPQAMNCPCSWFAGGSAPIKPYKRLRHGNYYKGKFKDIIPVYANDGFDDDGDKLIELCWEAEQQGYAPIGVTDGGGQISWSEDKLKQLKRTVFVGQWASWLDEAKEINPNIQIIKL